MLSILVLAINHVVTADRLSDLLWEGSPPPRAREILTSHASRIRKLLSSSRDDNQRAVLLSRGGGYQIRGDALSVDAHLFRSLLADATGTAALDRRIRLLERALGLWRGAPLADAASAALRQRLCSDLEELRLTAVEDLLAARLELEGGRQVLSELVRWSRAHPSRERLVELHMRALHESGRTADALREYERLRRHLAETLGVAPSHPLRLLHRQLLQEQLPQRDRSCGRGVTGLGVAPARPDGRTASVRPAGADSSPHFRSCEPQRR